MSIIYILIWLGFAYATYYYSQRYKANPYLWLTIGCVLSLLGFVIAVLTFRKKPVSNKKPNLIPPGYRTRTVWKMVLASICYLMIVIFLAAAFSATGTQASYTKENTGAVTENKITSVPTQTITPTSSPSSTPTSTTEAETSVVNGQLKIHYINVGQGDSELIQQGNQNMLIDTGTNASTSSLITYLQSKNIKKIDYLVLTHPHEDHIGGADAVIKTFDIGKIYMPNIKTTTTTFKDVASAINSKGLKAEQPALGTTFNLGDANCTVLGPVNSESGDLNTYSIVIKLVYGNNKFLFTGDTQVVNEEGMINKGYDLSADVLKVGHHGSSTSTSQEFLNKVNPKYAVICVGKGNDYGHPTAQTMDRLKAMAIKVYRTDENGTIICTSDGKNISFNCKPGDYAAGSGGGGSGSGSGSTSTGGSTTPKITPAPSNSSSNSNVIVYITNTGTKYHRAGCQYLSKSKISISLAQAKSEGYTPCSKCNPPQ